MQPAGRGLAMADLIENRFTNESKTCAWLWEDYL
jgi:hypothetical protein